MASSIAPHGPVSVFSIAPPPDIEKPMADPADVVCAGSPPKKTIAKESTKAKDGVPRFPHARLAGVCPSFGNGKGGNAAGRRNAAGRGTTPGRAGGRGGVGETPPSEGGDKPTEEEDEFATRGEGFAIYIRL